jgi:hypothetical protein
MTITKFEFTDKFCNWQLNNTAFSNFNLLVGLSGVGKTRTLKALELACSVGLDNKFANGCQWSLEIEFENKQFLWSVETSIVRETGPNVHETGSKRNFDDGRKTSENPQFINEKISVNGEIIVDRSEDKFIFKNTQLPKLKNTESAISLLSEEKIIAPLYQVLSRVTFFDDDLDTNIIAFDTFTFDKVRNRYRSIDELRCATDVHLIAKAYILQEDYPQEFEKIKADYISIFDTVVDIKIGKLGEFDPTALRNAPPIAEDWLVIAIKEDAVDDWITTLRISSGMLATLTYLFEIFLAAPGTVIVVDEIENSLGVNCLPQLTDHFLSRSKDLQFILTSHHPYVINNISTERWKVVTRQGSIVTILDKDDIQAINTNSSQEKFTLLMNLKEYEEGIQ